MYKEFSGRIWESEAKYNEYKSNVRKYMSRSLAVEHYADCSGDDSVFKEPAFVKLKITGHIYLALIVHKR